MNPPPVEGSKAYERDFEILHQHQLTRTEEQCHLARRQKWAEYRTLFGGHQSPINQLEYKHAEPLMRRVVTFAERVSVYFKKQFVRPRPYAVDSSLEPCVEKLSGSSAYPSSHAAVAAVGACVLAEIFPKKAEEILQYGSDIGDLRFVIGIHHPSDVEAAQKLGGEICDRLKSEKDFRRELKSLRK